MSTFAAVFPLLELDAALELDAEVLVLPAPGSAFASAALFRIINTATRSSSVNCLARNFNLFTFFLAFLTCRARSFLSLRSFNCCFDNSSNPAAIGSGGNESTIAAVVAAMAGFASAAAWSMGKVCKACLVVADREWAQHDVTGVSWNLFLLLCVLAANIPNWKWHVFYPSMENVYLVLEQDGHSNVSCQEPSGVGFI